jgi:hypothetical protein
MRARCTGERGQASVELLGVMPAVLLCAALMWQFVLGGAALWASAHAARSAARAAVVGHDAELAARAALPDLFERGLRVTTEAGEVTVRLRVPLIVPGNPGPLSVSASAALGAPP